MCPDQRDPRAARGRGNGATGAGLRDAGVFRHGPGHHDAFTDPDFAARPGCASDPPAAVAPTPPAASPPSDLRAHTAGEPVHLQAAPCRAEGRHVRLPIARPESLDPSYRGAANGIEIRRTIASGTAGFRHAKLSSGFFEADLWVRGSGISVGALGAESCKGGGPGDATFEVIAHYR